MTIIEAINKIDDLKPNDYTQTEKIDWLSKCDWLIKREIVDTHEGSESITFSGYDDNTPLDTVMIADTPYDELYLAWLESKIDYYNSEYSRYNNSVTRFTELYSALFKYYNRTKMPIGTNVTYF